MPTFKNYMSCILPKKLKYNILFTRRDSREYAQTVQNVLCSPRAGIFKQSMGARNRLGIGLSYRPARLHRLAEFIPWNRFLGSINV